MECRHVVPQAGSLRRPRVRLGDRLNAFYSAVLGASLIKQGDHWVYRVGNTQLNCRGPGANAYPVARMPVQPGNSELCFEWPEPITEARTHLERHGVEIEVGPVPRNAARGIGTSLYFHDPDGTLLEFISYENID